MKREDIESRLLLPYEVIDGELSRLGVAWDDLVAGDARVSLEGLQIYLMKRDPVLFCEAMLFERNDPGRRWRLWDYQKPSMRYMGNSVHECAAEVGKTRRIIGRAIWSALFRQGAVMVTTNQHGSLVQIYQDVLWQIRNNPWLAQNLRAARKSNPYPTIEFGAGDNEIRFLPAANDGEAYRGQHITNEIHADEWAKVHSVVANDELVRAFEPGCIGSFYSTPDGKRDSPFRAMCVKARPFRPEMIESPPAYPVVFRWRKDMMPPPFWSPERKKELVERYRGEDSPGYIRNVLGGWGDPVDSVFPWSRLKHCVRQVEEYRAVELVRAQDGSVSAMMRTYEMGSGEEFGRVATERAVSIDQAFSAIPSPRHAVVGGDLGYSKDETELLLCDASQGLRLVFRLTLKGFDESQQRPHFARFHAAAQPSLGWGIDAAGRGRAMEAILFNEDEHWQYDLTGYQGHKRVPELDPDTREVRMDAATGKPRTIMVKERATQLLESRIQDQSLELPPDPHVLEQMTSHTCHLNSNGERMYKKTDDHVVEALRFAALRMDDQDHGVPTVDPSMIETVGGSRFGAASDWSRW